MLQGPLNGFGEGVIDAGDGLDFFEGCSGEAVDGFEISKERSLFGWSDSGDSIKRRFANGTITEPAMVGKRETMGFIA
jgi:hypothetical protein